MNKNKKTI